jgi:hypothetical protein
MPAIYRVSLVQGSHEPVVKALRRDIEQATGELKNAMDAKHYGFVLLVDSPAKLQVLNAAIDRSTLRNAATIRVELSATAKTLATYLRRLKKKEP